MTAVWKRLLYVFALLGVVGTAAAFRGGALPGPAGRLTPVTQNWYGAGYFGTVYTPADTVLATYTVTTPSTLVSLTAGWFYANANGTSGTATIDLTTSAGVSLCHMNVTCTTLTAATVVSATCGVSLPVGTYQWRIKAGCPGTPAAGANAVAVVSTP